MSRRTTTCQVLVVEDDDATRGMLVLLFEDEGYQAVTAPDEQAALTQLPAGLRPCMLLLD